MKYLLVSIILALAWFLTGVTVALRFARKTWQKQSCPDCGRSYRKDWAA